MLDTPGRHSTPFPNRCRAERKDKDVQEWIGLKNTPQCAPGKRQRGKIERKSRGATQTCSQDRCRSRARDGCMIQVRARSESECLLLEPGMEGSMAVSPPLRMSQVWEAARRTPQVRIHTCWSEARQGCVSAPLGNRAGPYGGRRADTSVEASESLPRLGQPPVDCQQRDAQYGDGYNGQDPLG